MRGTPNRESPAPADRRAEKGCELCLCQQGGHVGRARAHLPDPSNKAALHQYPHTLWATPAMCLATTCCRNSAVPAALTELTGKVQCPCMKNKSQATHSGTHGAGRQQGSSHKAGQPDHHTRKKCWEDRDRRPPWAWAVGARFLDAVATCWALRGVLYRKGDLPGRPWEKLEVPKDRD